jgi:hypothetical protein
MLKDTEHEQVCKLVSFKDINQIWNVKGKIKIIHSAFVKGKTRNLMDSEKKGNKINMCTAMWIFDG